MVRFALLLVVAISAFGAAAPESAAGAPWRWPAGGDVVEHFVTGPDPFARGQHRGVDIATRPGAPVRAACAGRVRFAGAIGRAGRTVSVDCGGLLATHLHLRALTTRRGARVERGQRIGTAGAVLHLGARVEGRRWSYVDPLTLLPAAPAVPGPGPAPLPHAGAGRREPPRVAPRPAPARAPGSASIPAAVPLPVWLGMGLLGLAVPGLAVMHGRRGPHGRAAGERGRSQAAGPEVASGAASG